MELLKQARRAVEGFRPDEATDILQRFETAVVKFQISDAQKKRIAFELGSIAALSGAARDGAARAREQVRELRRLARSLDTYDRDGIRKERNTAGGTIGRF